MTKRKDNNMKVLLCEDIKKLGWFGDIVEVNTGYARNYLLPQGLAKMVSEGAVKSLAQEKAKRAEQRLQQARQMEAAAKAVDGAEAVLSAKVNEQGHLYGSITAEQIAANLRAQGFAVADDVVAMTDHIKQVGTHSVKLKYRDDLIVTVKVVVVGEQQVAEDEKTEEKQS
jgi:large subunit ribosomal protein L9